jgi:hypothetical protein
MRDRAEPNFGHHYSHCYGVHIDGWGDGPLLIRYNEREWWFEFSEMWGPTLLRKRDLQPSEKQPIREDDPFWAPFQLWMSGGRRCRAVWSRATRHPRRIKYWVCHVPKVHKP